jgi:glycerophosphoryl diester phosphodiesterase
LLAGGFVQGCGGGGASFNSAPPVVIPDVQPVDSGPTLSGLAKQTIYIAHRGSSALYPEETYVAYDESVRNGQVLLECDVQTLRDGNLGLMHDATVDRTTLSTGNVASMSEVDWRALRVDGNVWHGSNYGNDLTVPLFQDWVQRYRGKAIFVPEDKDLKSMSAMISMFDVLKINRDQVLLQSFSLQTLLPAVKAGYQTCLLVTGSVEPSAVVAAGVKWVGIPMGTAAELKKWVDSGLNVLLWTISRRFQRDEALALGVRGFFSDDPVYLQETRPVSTTDRFASGTWAPGMLGNGSDTSLALRGEFFSAGYWGYSSNQAGYLSCLHGYLCPIKSVTDPRRFEIALKIKFDSALANDATRCASVFLGVDDKPFLNGSESSAGYNLLLRKNGSIEIYKKTLGAKATLLATTATGQIADGEEIAFRITVTETSITGLRLNADGSDGRAAIAADSALQTVYLSLGRDGLACKFRDISVK